MKSQQNKQKPQKKPVRALKPVERLLLAKMRLSYEGPLILNSSILALLPTEITDRITLQEACITASSECGRQYALVGHYFEKEKPEDEKGLHRDFSRPFSAGEAVNLLGYVIVVNGPAFHFWAPKKSS